MGFMMLVFSVIYIVIQNRTFDINNSHTDLQAKALSDVILSEIDLAFLVHDGYKKYFWIPEYINGEEYNVEVIDNIEIIVTYRNKKHLAFLSTNITGQINQGYNTVIKNTTGVYIFEGKV